MITKILSSSGREYEIDTDKLTCTCPDFMYRRRHYSMDNEERLCKHLSQYLTEHPEFRPIELIRADKAKDEAIQMKDGKVRYVRSIFDSYVSDIRSTLSQFSEVKKYEICGSYRRNEQLVSDLDILLVLEDGSTSEALFNYCENSLGYVRQWRGDIKAGYLVDGFVHIDFKVVPIESWPFALCHFTGSKYENISLRKRANQLGWTLNEYGLFDDSGNRVEGIFETEKDIYNILKLQYKQPWER